MLADACLVLAAECHLLGPCWHATHPLLTFLPPLSACLHSCPSFSCSKADAASRKFAELEKREAGLAKREAGLEERETAASQRSSELEEREVAAGVREASMAGAVPGVGGGSRQAAAQWPAQWAALHATRLAGWQPFTAHCVSLAG